MLLDHILDLDDRGYAPSFASIKDMADLLLTSRGATAVGRLWASNFVKRNLELKQRYTCGSNFQRDLCENQLTINAWFERYTRAKTQHGIHDDNIGTSMKLGL